MTAPTLQPTVGDGLDLVRRFQAGDETAFAEIYRNHYRSILLFALHRVRDRQLAEDITQDTFTRAFSRLDKFEVRDRAIGAWLVTIARNLVVDHFKKKSTTRSAPYEIVPEHGADRLLPIHVAPADQQVLLDMDRAELLAAVQSLTAHQQTVIELRFFQQLSVAETSERMGLTDAAVKTAQHRAVQSLARYMRDQEQSWQGRVS